MREVTGWVHAANVTTLCQYLAAYTHVRWDDTDQDTLDSLLDSTNAETGKWFGIRSTEHPAFSLRSRTTPEPTSSMYEWVATLTTCSALA